MSPDGKYRKLADIFLNFLPKHVITEFKDAATDDDFIAESIFRPIWREIKTACLNAKIPITKAETIAFFNSVIGTEPEVTGIIHSFLLNDPEMLHQARMERDKLIQLEYAMAVSMQDKSKQHNMNRLEWLRSLVRQSFIKSSYASQGDFGRFETNFDLELRRLIKAIVHKQIHTTVEELKNIIKEEVPGVTSSSAFILKSINRFKSSIDSIKSREVGREEYAIVEIELDDDIYAILDAEWTDLDQLESKPGTEILELHKLQREDSTTGIPHFDKVETEISPKGIKQLMESIIFDSGAEEFYIRIKDMHEQVKIFCRDNNKLPDLLQIAFKLKNGYERNFKKSVEALNKKAIDQNKPHDDLELKIRYIVSALGVLWAFLSEAIPTMRSVEKK